MASTTGCRRQTGMDVGFVVILPELTGVTFEEMLVRGYVAAFGVAVSFGRLVAYFAVSSWALVVGPPGLELAPISEAAMCASAVCTATDLYVRV